MKNNCPKWLRDTVIYSLYPQSFYDTNGDGIGDLRGIKEKLPYIKELGCNAVWMNPIFESRFLDAGYDIDDFYKIAPRYGTEQDFIDLCDEAHRLGMKILLDLVAGHTSIECEWFKKFADGDEEYKDRFIWAPENADKKFTVNKGKRGGYYMYNYYDIQPAINYGFYDVKEDWQTPTDHPAAIKNQDELIKILDYWFKRGADGFRVDMAASLIKNDKEKAGCMKLWQKIRGWMDENYPENILISEWSAPDKSIPAGFHIDMMIHNTNNCLTVLFRNEHFAHKFGDVQCFGESYFRKEALGNYEDFTAEYVPFLEKTSDLGYMSFITGSHDIKRWTLGRDTEDIKVAYAFVMLMPGVPINYYGDEIGMNYLHITSKEGGRDRTGSRTPMQWCDGKNFGFSESDSPYLPVDTAADAPTVENQINDENSLLNFVKSLISLRKSYAPLLADGGYETVSSGYPLIFDRIADGERIRVAINASGERKEFADDAKEILFSYNADYENKKITLHSRSVIVYK